MYAKLETIISNVLTNQSFFLTGISFQANAQIYHYTTLALLIFTLYLEPDFAIEIFENMGAIMASLNITAFILSLYLTCGLQDENFEIPKNTGHLYNLVHGTQLYPYIMGISVKQIIVSRLGVTMCQMLNIVNLIAGIRLHGNTVDYGHLAHVLLQGIYFLKSCHLERVLVNFIDFTHDKVGLMLCWGCLVGIPAVQGFTAYLLVEHGTNVGIWEFSLIVSLGIIAIWFNYDVLRQKEMFREGVQNGSKVYIWGKEAKGREVFYKNVDINGKSGEMRNVLLVSGWWGIGRKMNYFWELVAILIWSYPGYYIGWRNYLNCFVLIGIFVSRSIREDNKCKMKYGRGWDEYCSKVPYRFIPFIF